MTGMIVSLFSALLFLVLIVRRIFVGSEAEGLFTLFSVVFLLIGICLFGIGLLGEYVGRIYAQVRERPRYIIEAVLEADSEGLHGSGGSFVERRTAVLEPTRATDL
jgi:undecaprenyl-phosphate 4-deoxy-4-formamido-L-arabinose transferase